jgi:hypothetical protein
VRIDDGALTLVATPGEDGMFRIPFSPIGRLELGTHTLAVDGVPQLYEGPETTIVVVLPTFAPQGPTGPAFNNSLLVARG